ncbi:hypothetical protein [Chitinophaga sp. sic0106]|uniref:hypothetical protein n=1 Tax=Chitinophaga sp. sic0106 TaxID=2854785 RepID=UPI001C482FDA|nr:hypothetical protein [Chitinophaga sp. sic0106]MBV7532890.1 hypothetical protein [Chitinophaga sp. sic0106]
MNNYQHIAAADLRDYAKSQGWQQLPEALADGLFVLNNPRYAQRQIVFPIDASACDYVDAIDIALHKLAFLEQKPLATILGAINEIKDDTLRFRLVDTRTDATFIPLPYAISAINGAKEMLLAGACTVLRPQLNHPRLSGAEALELIDKTRFRQTEIGSFVIKVSTPVRALNIQGSLFEEDFPFVRQTTLAINRGLSTLITAIETDTLENMIEQVKFDPAPAVSANLCKAVTNFQEQHDAVDLYIDFSWAGAVTIPGELTVQNQLKIQNDYFSRIDDVRRELKRSEELKLEDVFMATVENLSGEIGFDNKRSGDVILYLYKDSEVIRARTILDAEQYLKADISHMTADSYLRIKGKLYPGNQPRILSDITLFELIMP